MSEVINGAVFQRVFIIVIWRRKRIQLFFYFGVGWCFFFFFFFFPPNLTLTVWKHRDLDENHPAPSFPLSFVGFMTNLCLTFLRIHFLKKKKNSKQLLVVPNPGAKGLKSPEMAWNWWRWHDLFHLLFTVVRAIRKQLLIASSKLSFSIFVPIISALLFGVPCACYPRSEQIRPLDCSVFPGVAQ